MEATAPHSAAVTGARATADALAVTKSPTQRNGRHDSDGDEEDDLIPLSSLLPSSKPAIPRKRALSARVHVSAVNVPPAPRSSRTSQRASSSGTDAVQTVPASPSASSSRSPLPSPEDNDDYCAVCGHLGNVLCCLYCVHSYHFSCIAQSAGVACLDDVSDSWQCSDAGKKCTARTAALKCDAALSDEQRTAFRWTSKPTKARGGDRHYTSFTRATESYSVGDVVLLKVDDSAHACDLPDRVAEIEDAWEDIVHERWLLVRWYWHPEETRHGRLVEHEPMEVFATAHVGEVFADAIQGKVSVLSEDDYRRREERRELDDSTFLCRQRYDHDRGQFRPIVVDASAKRGRPQSQQRDDGDDDWELDGAGGQVKKRRKHDDGEASVYSRACSALQLSSLPASLPCREKEEQHIRAFLTAAIRRGGQAGGGLYIAGVPGTGKTATVRQVLGSLARHSTCDPAALERDAQRVPPFQFVEVNGMKLPDASHAYSHIWQSLTGKRASPGRACALLDARFKARSSRRPVVVLLVDEIDFCVTRHQQLLYHLADWPTHRAARLVTVSISNTIDFPTLLHERVRSRFVSSQLTFRPYTAAQVQAIVDSRLRSLPRLFDERAVELCARKIAAINGDVRVALEICRRAAAIAEERGAGTVGMDVVQRAITDIQGGSDAELVRRLTLYEMALLAAVYGENKEDSAFVALDRASDRMRRVMKGKGAGVELSEWEVHGVCSALVAVGLMEWRWVKGQQLPEVRMTMAPHICAHALKDNEHWNAMTS